MSAVAIVLAILGIAAVGALTYLTVRSTLLPAPPLTGATVEIHTKRPDDQTIRGLLVAQHADRLTLIDAVYRHASGDQPINGTVHVPNDAISWLTEVDS